MLKLITLDTEKCSDCQNCVRVCPVHAITIASGKDFPEIEQKRCTGCGTCVVSCSSGAISYYDSKQRVQQLIKDGNKVAALVDPSISVEFPDIIDYRKFVEMIRLIGFTYVIDTSFGVDLVSLAYKKLFEKSRGKYYIMANCPAIVHHTLKFHPSLADNLAPIVSPMTASALVAKYVYGEHIKTVFIGPCIAAKLDAGEFETTSPVDEALTYAELRNLFDQNNLHESQLEFSEFDPPQSRYGTLYPMSNGILQAGNISDNYVDGDVITAEGNKASLKALESFEKNIDLIKKHLNVFYNQGCLMGPGITIPNDSYKRFALALDYAKRRLGKSDVDKWHQEMEKFSVLDLSRKYVKDDQRLEEPSVGKVDEILKLLGKYPDSNGPLCSQCGFESCRHFAKAVAQGVTRTDMCFDFSLKNKNNYIATLRNSNTWKDKEVANLKNELNEIKTDYELVNDKLETSRAIMNQIPSGVVIVDEDLKIISSNRSFIDVLGNEAKDIDEVIPGLRGADLKTLVPVHFYKTFQNVLDTSENILSRDVKIGDALLNISVFSIKPNKVAGGIIRDMFSPEVRNEQIIQRVTEVIDENLTMVQQIGFLLGEGASKTEAMLNSIIQLHKNPKK
jgi:iron only hydrogenase large subunit-like protein